MRWIPCIMLLTLILLGGCTRIKQETREVASSLTTGDTPLPEVHDAVFECENDNSAQKRGYILLMGYGSIHRDSHFIERKVMEQDPKAMFVDIYPQDATLHIEEISELFIAHLNELLAEHDIDELIMFGVSAGGVTASYSLSRLPFEGPVELHTLASPLNGYDLTGFRAQFIGDRTGYLKDIAIGFEPFDSPGDNIKVYHHKTVTDSVLIEYCGAMAGFCDTLKIQNNNVEGSKEFYYPEYDHDMTGVILDILQCYEIPGIEEIDLETAPGFGTLCVSEDGCYEFCMDSMGRCKEYCDSNPENPLCESLFIDGHLR